ALRRPNEIDVRRRSYRGPEDADEIDEVVDPLPHRQPVLAVASGREGEAQAVDDSGHRGAIGQLELVLGDARWRVEGDVSVGVEHEIAVPMAGIGHADAISRSTRLGAVGLAGAPCRCGPGYSGQAH